MPVFNDQLGREVNCTAAPKRIISLVPSQTELLFFLGLDREIAGVTKFCIHPGDKVSTKPKIGGTKQLNIAAIHSLTPDLIIANKEENDQRQVEELMLHYPVWISDVDDLDSALQMITGIGSITCKIPEAVKLADTIRSAFSALRRPQQSLSTAYFIWRMPYMVAGQGTFINHLMDICGFENVCSASRYPELAIEEIIAARPRLVLLSSEPYPFGEKHFEEFKAMLPDAQIMLVDGEMFSWYGSRLLYAPAYFTKLISSLQIPI